MKTALDVKTRPAVTFMFSNRFITNFLCFSHCTSVEVCVDVVACILLSSAQCTTDGFDIAIIHNALKQMRRTAPSGRAHHSEFSGGGGSKLGGVDSKLG